MYKNNHYTPPRSRKKLVLIISIIVLLAGIAAALELSGTTHFLHEKKPSYNNPTAGPATKGIPNDEQQADKNGGQNNGGTTGNPSSDPKHPIEPVPDGTPLTDPTGNFISTHSFFLSANPQMESICNTTPGATCKITFTNGNTTKSLATQVTDRGGATYWAWKPKDSNINLTPGTWTVAAVVQLGTQTKTATDATTLEVSQ